MRCEELRCGGPSFKLSRCRLVAWADPSRSILFSDASLDNPDDQESNIGLLPLSYDNRDTLIRQILQKFD